VHLVAVRRLGIAQRSPPGAPAGADRDAVGEL